MHHIDVLALAVSRACLEIRPMVGVPALDSFLVLQIVVVIQCVFGWFDTVAVIVSFLVSSKILPIM